MIILLTIKKSINAMINIEVGQYIYFLRFSQFRIYQCDYNDGKICTYTPVVNEPFYNDKESARKRVYELNGWDYKSKN